MALAITSAVILIFLVSQSALAFVKGDKVRLTMSPKLGPFTVESCQTEDSQKICKLKEARYFVSALYLRKSDEAAKVAKEASVEETSGVRVQVMGR
ncbi:hypothetical protein AZI86_14580 [Bdellovibrio bacteriovorus]|uniref:Uncharacterized protein n=1 Tax=Bdellovibrio bacteriovorus TaxID=959 RepID=A0A150WK09_BDEBC|nr:hypothetical protein [Bdellovibrio bacteriovorus]KYG64030.1 hypothetical protein AZI86_14580 [Bdellovibrio bacteriovorus]